MGSGWGLRATRLRLKSEVIRGAQVAVGPRCLSSEGSSPKRAAEVKGSVVEAGGIGKMAGPWGVQSSQEAGSESPLRGTGAPCPPGTRPPHMPSAVGVVLTSWVGDSRS